MVLATTAWAVRAFWCLVGLVCFFSGLRFTAVYLSKRLWYATSDRERRARRRIGYLGALLLCAAAVVFIGLF